MDVLSTTNRWLSPQSVPHSRAMYANAACCQEPPFEQILHAGSATLELLSALRYPRLTQALYIVAHGLGDIRKVLLYGRLDGESRL